MLCIVVDLNYLELVKTVKEIETVHPNFTIMTFQDALLAFQYAFQNKVAIAYVDVKLNRISGVELAKMLLTTKGHPQVVLIGDDERSKKDALRIGATGFMMKPVTAEKVVLSENMEW